MAVPKDEVEKRTDHGLSYADVVSALYLGILGRPADQSGFESYLGALQKGVPLSDLIREMRTSDEFKSHQQSALAKLDHFCRTLRNFIPKSM